ncbi:MAG: PQQ-binding-like beta-propeller repeat protein [Planctomycetota bacterium]|nr:PQQ-binding-like beta-propeller repeat protein [Planctomycetota bacterium]
MSRLFAMWPWAILIVCCLAAAAPAEDAGVSAADILKASGIGAGLVVHLVATDGRLEAELAASGKMLVHGLAMDDAASGKARSAIKDAGLYGLASVEKADSFSELPYADNLVNLLVADLDALGAKAPPQAEIMRVLCPKGVAYVKIAGAWTRTVKPRPPEMDEWGHFDYGPEGNGVSHDRLVGPSTHVQWMASVQPIKLGGNPAGFRVYAGPRAAGGRVFFEWGAGEKSGREQFYTGRDAFNGLPLWTARNTSGGRKDWQFVAAGDRLYTFLEKGGPLVALDGATGAIVRTYEQGGRLTDDWRATAIRVAGGKILQVCGSALYALDAASGALVWKHEETDGNLCFPCASPKDDCVFVAVADPPTQGSSRWPVAKARAILRLELASGKPVWRSTDIAGFCVGQLVYDGGNLAVFASGAIGGGEEPFIGLVRGGDGKLLFHNTFKKNYNRFGYNLLVRDGRLYYADAWRIYATDPATGEETRAYDDSGYNMRCNRFSATDTWFIYGLVGFVDRDARGLFQSITRSGCAIGATPANGMLYFTPNACGCITELRGHIALSSEPLRAAVPDAKRLEQVGGGARPSPVASTKLIANPTGPIAEDWPRQDRGAAETPPATADSRTYVARVHEHRLECRDASGKVLWAFTADGRISGPPVVQAGLCIFGSHDGWVYCLKADPGVRIWRFLAAPYERKMIVAGQLESSWPVYGVVMHAGLVCFAAGRHPEAGGGIYVYGLQPKTGELVWKKVLRRAPVAYDGKGKFSIKPNRILNDALKSDGQALSLPGITFTPDEADDEIQKKVDGNVPPPAKPAKEKG